MDIREVKIEEYWPAIVKGTVEFGQIAVAENPEFNLLAECIYNALNDAFITTGTVYCVSRWENMLGLAVTADMSLEDRKSAILYHLSVKRPYTWRVLKQLIEGVVGAGNYDVEFNNDEGKLIVHTNRISDEKSQVVTDLIARVVPENLVIERYNHHIEVNWRDINKYAECKTRADVEAVNPDYINDLTVDGEWVYPLPNLESFKLAYQEKTWSNGKLKKWRVPLPKLTSVPSWWFSCSTIEYMDLYAPEAQNLYDPLRWCGNVTYCKVYAPKTTRINNLVTYNSKLKEIEIDTPNVTNAQGAFFRLYGLERIICTPDMFHKVTNGADMYLCNYKLLDFPTSYPSLSTAAGMFDKCEITGQQAILVLNSMPSYSSGTHEVTMGIHIDYQKDSEVLAAIENAKNKGWTVTVQWNGTPTSGVSTTDLEEIYAKVEEYETGEYTDENGNRCTLSWGHDVKSPDGKTPAELGYKLFFSLVEAEHYYKLSKIEGIENE